MNILWLLFSNIDVDSVIITSECTKHYCKIVLIVGKIKDEQTVHQFHGEK